MPVSAIDSIPGEALAPIGTTLPGAACVARTEGDVCHPGGSDIGWVSGLHSSTIVTRYRADSGAGTVDVVVVDVVVVVVVVDVVDVVLVAGVVVVAGLVVAVVVVAVSASSAATVAGEDSSSAPHAMSIADATTAPTVSLIAPMTVDDSHGDGEPWVGSGSLDARLVIDSDQI